MNVKVIVDSTADMRLGLQEQVRIVPLTVHFGNEALIDGVTIDRQHFYERLAESGPLPTTSQPSPAAFEHVYRELTEAGNSAVVITISSKLSGTYQSACIAAEDYDNIFVVDSMTATAGTGILAEYALRRAEDGMDAETLAKHLTEMRRDIRVVVLLDTLEYLKKGGRISATTAIAGGILNIKPLVAVEQGEVVSIGKVRGSRSGNGFLMEKIYEQGGIDRALPFLLAYTGLSDAKIRKFLLDSRALWTELGAVPQYTQACSVIGTHAGPGAVIAAFFARKPLQ